MPVQLLSAHGPLIGVVHLAERTLAESPLSVLLLLLPLHSSEEGDSCMVHVLQLSLQDKDVSSSRGGGTR